MDHIQGIFSVLGFMLGLYLIGFLLNLLTRRYDNIANPPLVIRAVTALGAVFYILAAPVSVLVFLFSKPLEDAAVAEARRGFDKVLELKDREVCKLQDELASLRRWSEDDASRYQQRGYRLGYEKGYSDCKNGLPSCASAIAGPQSTHSVSTVPGSDAPHRAGQPTSPDSPNPQSNPRSPQPAPVQDREPLLNISTFTGHTLCVPMSKRDEVARAQKASEAAYFEAHGSSRDQLLSCLESCVYSFLPPQSPASSPLSRTLLATAFIFSSDSVMQRYPIYTSLCSLSLQSCAEGRDGLAASLRASQQSYLFDATARWPSPKSIPPIMGKPSARSRRDTWLKAYSKFVVSQISACRGCGASGKLVAAMEDFESSARILLRDVPVTHQYL